jgi:hypothetical protein
MPFSRLIQRRIDLFLGIVKRRRWRLLSFERSVTGGVDDL